MLLGHRLYDTLAGRFLTRDPLGYGGGVKLYDYTQNDPVNMVDPEGLTSIALPGPIGLPGFPGWGGILTGLGGVLGGIGTGLGRLGSTVLGGVEGIGALGTLGLIGGGVLGLQTPAGPTSEFPPDHYAPQNGVIFAKGKDNMDHMGKNQHENRLTDKIAQDMGLTGNEPRQLHDAITGEGLSPEEIRERAQDILDNRGSNNLGRSCLEGRIPGGAAVAVIQDEGYGNA